MSAGVRCRVAAGGAGSWSRCVPARGFPAASVAAGSAWSVVDRGAFIGVAGLYTAAGAGLGMMSDVNRNDLLVSRAGLGVVAVFRGFERNALWAFEGDWGLEVTATDGAGDGSYLIEREAWSAAARLVCAGARERAARQALARIEARRGGVMGVVSSDGQAATDSQAAADSPGARDGLVRVACGSEDALINRAGVVWLAPGRRSARVVFDPACRDPLAVDELIGAALTHAMALAGLAPLHGMAAEIDGVGVLALGESMAGKSTLALAILHAGGRVVSDDFLLVGGGEDGPKPTVGALRRDLYVREGSFDLIPEALRARFSDNGAGPGRLVLRRDDAPDAFVTEVSPAVVWFLDGARGEGNVEVAAMSQAEALGSLVGAGSPLFVSGRYQVERATVLPRLVEVAQSAQSFSVLLSAGLLRSPGVVVRELLARTISRQQFAELRF